MGRKAKGKGRGKLRKKDRAKDLAPVAPEGAAGTAAWHGAVERSVGPADGEAASAYRPAGHAQPPSPIEATELAALLASLGTGLHRQLAWGDVGEGLTRARLSALAVLVLGGPRTLAELATAERVRPPTMTRLVRAMEADGLVTRARHPGDGRSIIIRATATGERSLAAGRSQQLAPLADAISDLDRVERRRLEDAAEVLGRLLRDVSRVTGPAG